VTDCSDLEQNVIPDIALADLEKLIQELANDSEHSGYVPASNSKLQSGYMPPCNSVCEPEIVNDDAFEEIIQLREAEQVRLSGFNLYHGDQERVAKEPEIDDAAFEQIIQRLEAEQVRLQLFNLDYRDDEDSYMSQPDEYRKRADILKNGTRGDKDNVFEFEFGRGIGEWRPLTMERTVLTQFFLPFIVIDYVMGNPLLRCPKNEDARAICCSR
jgi:hypothetical protein